MILFRKRKKRKERNPQERITLRYKGFITIPELAFVLRVSVRTVHNWIGNRWEQKWKLEGFPPLLVRGKRWVFQVADIEEFFDIEIGREFAQPLLSCRDIQKITGYGETSVRNWLREARTRKIGKVVIRIHKRDLEAFLFGKYGWQSSEKDRKQYRESRGRRGGNIH